MSDDARNKANCKNAEKSTGPKTSEGKTIVSKNAIKHGIFSKELTFDKRNGKENESDFDFLLTKLTEDLQPKGKLEEILVEKIAVNYWRLCRLIRFESGKNFEIVELMSNRRYNVEVEKIVKYENSLERSIFRNLAVLNELQKRRN